jgi:hypothetical protein
MSIDEVFSVGAEFKALHQHFPKGPEENHESE